MRHLAQLRRSSKIDETGDTLLLPEELDENGQLIVDEMAVEILQHGWRVVRATWTERMLAASYIVTHCPDDAVTVVSERLGIGPEAAYQLTEALRATGNTPLSFPVDADVSTSK